MSADENGCEHGDHPAPPNKRFCSEACMNCERYSESDNGCDGICGRDDGGCNVFTDGPEGAT